MPRHLLPLRLLLLQSAASRRAAATVAFPHLPPNPPRNADSFGLLRFFSARPSRPRGGGGGGGGAAAAGKSLIEDEAELSDWISDLKTDSFRLGLSSGGEDSDSDRPRSRATGGSRNSRRGGLSSPRRRRDDVPDELSGYSDRGRSRNSRNMVSKRMLGGDLDDDESDDEVGFSSLRGRRDRSVQGRKPSAFARRGRRDGDLDSDDEEDNEIGFSSRKAMREHGGRGGRPLAFGRRGRRDSDLDDDEEDEEEEFRFSSKRGSRERGGRGGKASVLAPRRGGMNRNADFGDRQPRGGKMFDFGGSEEVEGEDEDDGLSGLDDGLFDDEGGKKEEPLMDAVKSLRSTWPVEGVGAAERGMCGQSDSYLSQTRFDECSLSPLTLKGVKAAGYERMTVVQEATLPVILEGKDVLAKAKTGTGKTVAFLLPAIEVVSKLPPVDRDQRRPPINVVVVCPTRELADQAAAEANKLLKYHPSIGVQLVIGGTRLALEQKRMQTNPCQILVATPGRLRDHIENTPGFATRLMGVKVLVLDEADRLLDMGFRTDIEKIVAAVPKQRQTLLFSATVPDEVRQVCYIAMKRDLEFVNTVEEGSEETHSQVKQMHLVSPLEKHFSILYGILTEHVSENVDYKVIVFCTTAMVTRLVAELLSELKLNVREIHSRKPQSYRTRISKEFKESKGLILVSSDVSARGVDYPNVSLVIQLGVPTDREQYIHRLGRTGRKGKEGTGILLLAPWEEFFLRSLKNLPITEASQPLIDLDIRKKVERALAHVEVKDKESAYQAWLGYYNSNKKIGGDKYQLVALANEFSHCMGLNNPPALPKLVLRKMGLTNIPGLRSK